MLRGSRALLDHLNGLRGDDGLAVASQGGLHLGAVGVRGCFPCRVALRLLLRVQMTVQVDLDRTLVGEFDGIAEQIEEDLAQPSGISYV